MNEIREYDFDSIAADYASGGSQGNTFNLSQINGMGIIYIDLSNSLLLEIEIVVSWLNQFNRVIGEDQDLDGVLDAGEDLNNNGKLDSVVEMVSLVAKK